MKWTAGLLQQSKFTGYYFFEFSQIEFRSTTVTSNRRCRRADNQPAFDQSITDDYILFIRIKSANDRSQEFPFPREKRHYLERGFTARLVLWVKVKNT
jgi:hypothetical protein